jgi:streptomycin 6-kinase
MPHTFPVPDAYRDQDLSPARQAWITRLPATAVPGAALGSGRGRQPMFGFLGIVWPVRDAGGRRLVLKVHSPHLGGDGERVALEAARGPALVELVRADPTANALLLERLDPKEPSKTSTRPAGSSATWSRTSPRTTPQPECGRWRTSSTASATRSWPGGRPPRAPFRAR